MVRRVFVLNYCEELIGNCKWLAKQQIFLAILFHGINDIGHSFHGFMFVKLLKSSPIQISLCVNNHLNSAKLAKPSSSAKRQFRYLTFQFFVSIYLDFQSYFLILSKQQTHTHV